MAMASNAQPYSPINQNARHGVLRDDDFDGSIGCRLLVFAIVGRQTLVNG